MRATAPYLAVARECTAFVEAPIAKSKDSEASDEHSQGLAALLGAAVTLLGDILVLLL